jgi:iron complex transport system permease protein
VAERAVDNTAVRGTTTPPGKAPRAVFPVLLILAPVLLVIAFIAAISIGPVTVPLTDLAHSDIVREIRLPRVIIAGLVGAGLATAGALMQTVFLNPLADPGIVGVSSGAAVAAVIVIVSGAGFLGRWTLPAGAFIGALATVLLIYLIANSRAVGGRGADPATLVLVGMAITAFLGAVISAVIANAPDDSDLRSVQFWMNGDLVARTWDHVKIATVPILGGIVLSWFLARDLNVLLLGPETAQSSGVDVRRLRIRLLALAAWITASGVAVSGAISFIGLVVPHFVRILLGPDHRRLLPVAAVLGATFVIVSDIIARMLFSPIVLQTGTVIAFLGSPLFLWLLLTTRSRRHKGLGV